MENGNVKKLSKEQREVWDRLKNGIPRVDDYESVEDIVTKAMAKSLVAEIDKEIIKELLDLYADSA